MNAIASYLLQMLVPALAGALIWFFTRPLRLGLGKPRSSRSREIAWLILFMFVAGLLALTITPAGFWPALLHGEKPMLMPDRGGREVNLVPFVRSLELLRYYIRNGYWSAILVNFPGNIVMFLPIGFFAALLSDKPRWWKSVLITAALSAFIEFFQLFVARGTDVDDLILNTLGGLCGYWVYLLVRRGSPGFVSRCGRRKGRS